MQMSFSLLSKSSVRRITLPMKHLTSLGRCTRGDIWTFLEKVSFLSYALFSRGIGTNFRRSFTILRLLSCAMRSDY